MVQKVSILDFNFLGIPVASKNYYQRLKVLIEEITKINPDILCFQEMWFGFTRNYLQKKLKPLGFNFFFHPVSRFRSNGLLTFSKKEILETKFFGFKPLFRGFDFSFFELMGAKGCSLMKIKLADKKEIFLFNVHLSVDWKRNSDFSLFKLKEIEVLSAAINQLGKEKIIVVGDFNFDFQTKLYQKLMAMADLRDALTQKGAPLTTVLPNLYHFNVPKWGKEIDFVFVKNLPEDSVLNYQVLWDKPFKDVGYLSDHAGVLAQLKI